MSRKVYTTAEERLAARNARQNAKRARLLAAGLTSKGKPRKRERYVRGADIHFGKFVQSPSVPCQSTDEYIARGGYVERLPGPDYSRPPRNPVSLSWQGAGA